MSDDLVDAAINVGLAAVAAGLVYGVHEVFHMVADGMASAVVVDNVGSVALGLLAVAGVYLVSLKNEVEFEPTVGGAAFALMAAVHSAHHFLQPEAIGMVEAVTATAFVGVLIVAFLPQIEDKI